jgi:acetylornithine deacetylase/succinyl-diaminopimelate desuccinylase-like protein
VLPKDFTMALRIISVLLMLACFARAEAQTSQDFKALSHDLLKQLVEIDTTDAHGNVTTASLAMAKRLTAAGYGGADLQVLGPNERKKNLVARLHGTGKRKPVLLIGHLDVVEARREDWTSNPFELIEKGGFFFGRGTLDMKDGDAVLVASLIRLKQEGFKPDRDIILALTADEEGGTANGVEWLLKNHRDLIDAEFVINLDDWTIWTQPGPPRIIQVDATEKVYADYELLVTSPGGHSSEPSGENAIYQLTAALARLRAYQFPFELNAVTRAYYERMAQIASADRAAQIRALLREPPAPAAIPRLDSAPTDYALTHTTCVPTRLQAGHANNALPQRATANVNCRILPGHSLEKVRQEVLRVLADPGITVSYVADNGHSTPVAPERHGFAAVRLDPNVMDPLKKVLGETWPGRIAVPTMAIGASDAIYTVPAGLPTYCLAVIALPPELARAHGRDERIPVDDFYRYAEFFFRYLEALTR